jgi:hypothetical protein
MLLGPGLAALLGSELAAPTLGGWGFLLARPVGRRRILATRAAADFVTLALVLAILLGVLGDAGRSPWLWGVPVLLWVVTHGLTAWAGSLGLGSMSAVAAGFAWGALGLAAGLAGSLGGLRVDGFKPKEVLWAGLLDLAGKEPVGYALWVGRVPYIAVALGLIFTMAWGWRTAAIGIRESPIIPAWRPELARALAGLALLTLVISGASVAAGRTLPLGKAETERMLVGALGGGDVVTLERSGLGIPQLKRYDAAGRLVWHDAFLDGCGIDRTRISTPGTLVMVCSRYEYVFRASTEAPEVVRMGPTGNAPMLLSPDGRRLLYVDDQVKVRIRPVLSAEPGSILPDQGGLRSISGRWGDDDVIRLIDTTSGVVQLHRGSDGARLKRLELTDSIGEDVRYDVDWLKGGELLVTVRPRGESVPKRTVIVQADGSIRELESERPTRVVGEWTAGELVSAGPLEGGGTRLWRRSMADGRLEPLAELPGVWVQWTWKDPDGPGVLVRYSEGGKGPFIAPLVAGRLGEARLVEKTIWGETGASSGAFPEGLVALLPGQPSPGRIAWAETGPLATDGGR